MINIAAGMKAIKNTMSDITRAKKDYLEARENADHYYDNYSNSSSSYYRKRYYAIYSKHKALASTYKKTTSNLYDGLKLQLKNLREQAGARADEVLTMKKEEKNLYELQLDSKQLKTKNAEAVLVTQAKASYQLMQGVTNSLRTINIRNKSMMLRTMRQLDEAARINLEDLERALMVKVTQINTNVDQLDAVNTKQAGSLIYSITRAGSAKLDALGIITRRKSGGKPLDAIFLGSMIGIGLAKLFWSGKTAFNKVKTARDLKGRN